MGSWLWMKARVTQMWTQIWVTLALIPNPQPMWTHLYSVIVNGRTAQRDNSWLPYLPASLKTCLVLWKGDTLLHLLSSLFFGVLTWIDICIDDFLNICFYNYLANTSTLFQLRKNVNDVVYRCSYRNTDEKMQCLATVKRTALPIGTFRYERNQIEHIHDPRPHHVAARKVT